MKEIYFSARDPYPRLHRWRNWLTVLMIFLIGQIGFAQCNYTLELSDSWGDGWNGGKISVFVNGVVVLEDHTLSGSYTSYDFPVETGDDVTTTYTPGSYSYENGYRILDANGNVVFTSNYDEDDGPPVSVSSGQITAECPACPAPTGFLSSTTHNSATIGWTSSGTDFEVNWGTGTFAAGEGANTQTVTGTSYSFPNNLLPTTTYRWFIRQNCGGNGMSTWAGPYTFTTSVAPTTAPWNEGFATTSTPAGWTTTGWTINTHARVPSLDGNHIHKNLYNFAPTGTFTTINVEGVSTGDVLSFDYILTDWTNYNDPPLANSVSIAINISVNGGAFDPLATITDATAPTGWQYFQQDLSAYAGQNIKIQVVATWLANDFVLAFDNFFIGTPPSCIAPTSLTTTNPTANSTELGWASDGSSFDIKWGPTGFDVETEGTLVENFTNGGTLSGLSSQTAYQFYVRQDCGVDGLSLWAGPLEFTTLCDPATSGFSQNFDSGSAGSSTNPNLTDCWSFIDTGAGSGYVYNFSSPYSAPNHFYITNSSDNSGDYILVSPPTDNLGNGAYWVKFYAKAGAANYSLEFGTLSDGTDAATFTVLETISLTTTYQEYIVLLPAGTDDYFGFRHGLGGTFRSIYIDDIVYEEIPSCLPPTATLGSVSPTGASFNWSAVDGADGYDWIVVADGADPGTGTPVSSGTTTGLTATATGLASGTAYDFYIKSDCGTDGESNWTKVDFSTPLVASVPWTEGLDTTSIPGWLTSGYNLLLATNTVGYPASAKFNDTSTYLIYRNPWSSSPTGNFTTISVGEVSASHVLTFDYKLVNYGDNNPPAANSGRFTVEISTDFGATYQQIDNVMNDGIAGWKTKTYPLSAYAGQYVIVRITDIWTSGDYFIGFDNFFMGAPPTCSPPSGASFVAADGFTAEFSWTEALGENIEGYNWVVVADGEDPDTATPVASGNTTDTFIIATGLSPETAYDFYVRTDCGTGDGESVWSTKLDFSTTEACPSPTGLTHTQLNLSSAVIAWTSDGTQYEVKWGTTAFDPETEGSLITGIEGTSYELSGLTADTSYRFYVRRDCTDTDDGNSSWAGPYVFSVGYCPAGSSNANDERIGNFTFIDINQNSTATTGYENFTAVSTEVEAGSTNPFSVTITNAYASDQVLIWIDYNQDGVFSDDEKAFESTPLVEGDPSVVIGDINIPITALAGNTRLRVRMHYTTSGGNYTPCGNSGYGQVEDYTVNILAPVTWTGAEWINGVPAPDVSVLIDGALSTDGLEVDNLWISENGSINLESGNSMTVNGKIVNGADAGSFVIQNNANLIQTTDASINTGAITVIRESQDLVRLDYTMWSSPVAGQNLFGFSPETVNGVTNYPGSEGRIYVYDGSNGYVNPTPFTETTVMNNGTGYLFRAPNNWSATTAEPYIGTFTGVPNNGNINATTHVGNFTSIGNPYPSNITVNALYAANTGINTLYLWNNNYSSGNNYATCTNGVGCAAATGGGNTPNGVITVGQGFIVHTADASVAFNNSMRVNSNGIFFKVDELESHRFWLNLNGEEEEKFNQILIGYVSEATNGVDNQIDGKMFNYEGSALYSIVDEEKLVIQGRALPFEATDVVPLGFRAAEGGKFTISLADFDGLFAEGSVTVHLKDNELNVTHNLMESDYVFESVQGTFKERFEVVYETDETMGATDFNDNLVQIYQQDNQIVVSSKTEKILSVELFDMQGRNIHSNQKVNANIYQIQSASFGTQVLVVRVQTQNGEILTKKVITK